MTFSLLLLIQHLPELKTTFRPVYALNLWKKYFLTLVQLQNYLEVRRHCQSFRSIAAKQLQANTLDETAQADVISKHFQVIKLELEAALKLEDWDSLDNLFEECWKYKDPQHFETLADLVLVIHSCVVKANIDGRYQTSRS